MNLGHETEQVEFKKSTSELKEGIASIAAILNKRGCGELFFGVNNNGDVCGMQASDSTLREISQAIGRSIEPRIFPSVELLDDGEGRGYIRVAFQGSDQPYSCKGTYRIRVADEDVVMTAVHVKAMIRANLERDDPWDRKPSGKTVADTDEATVRAYVERGNECGRIPFPHTTTESALASLDLLVGDRLTNAGDVLFCPSKDIPTQDGHPRHACAHRDSRASARAVKEALVNAYAHCDWTDGGCVQIDIFHDAVEILSPGWFIEGQDPEEHLSGKSTSSKGRNKFIAQALYRSGDIESYGTGIPRIRDLCAEVGVRIEYVKVPDGTKLVFHRNDAFAGSGAEHQALKSTGKNCHRVSCS